MAHPPATKRHRRVSRLGPPSFRRPRLAPLAQRPQTRECGARSIATPLLCLSEGVGHSALFVNQHEPDTPQSQNLPPMTAPVADLLSPWSQLHAILYSTHFPYCLHLLPAPSPTPAFPRPPLPTIACRCFCPAFQLSKKVFLSEEGVLNWRSVLCILVSASGRTLNSSTPATKFGLAPQHPEASRSNATPGAEYTIAGSLGKQAVSARRSSPNFKCVWS